MQYTNPPSPSPSSRRLPTGSSSPNNGRHSPSMSMRVARPTSPRIKSVPAVSSSSHNGIRNVKASDTSFRSNGGGGGGLGGSTTNASSSLSLSRKRLPIEDLPESLDGNSSSSSSSPSPSSSPLKASNSLRPSRSLSSARRSNRSRERSRPRHLPTPSPIRSVSASSCPEPRTMAMSNVPVKVVCSEISAEGEVILDLDRRKIDEILVELRDARSSSSSGVRSDEDEEAEDLLPTPYIYDCTQPLSIPDVPPSASLPSPHSSPPRTSATSSLLRPSPVPLHPNRASPRPSSSFAQSFEETLSRTSSSQNISTSPPSSRARSRAGSRSTSKDEGIVKSERPTLMSYTSFEAAFDLKPPPSPPPSPTGGEGKSWWR